MNNEVKKRALKREVLRMAPAQDERIKEITPPSTETALTLQNNEANLSVIRNSQMFKKIIEPFTDFCMQTQTIASRTLIPFHPNVTTLGFASLAIASQGLMFRSIRPAISTGFIVCIACFAKDQLALQRKQDRKDE